MVNLNKKAFNQRLQRSDAKELRNAQQFHTGKPLWAIPPILKTLISEANEWQNSRHNRNIEKL